MKRHRIKLFTQEQEEDLLRKNGLRKRKQVKYNDKGYEGEEEEEEEEEEEDEDQDDDEQIKRKTPRAKAVTEEDINRKISLRKKKKVKYNDDGNEEEEEDEDQEDEERPGPSTNDTHTQRAEENGECSCSNQTTRGAAQRLFPVTCGNTKGVLAREKLLRGEECIACEGGWFSPAAFEDLGGKGSSKKWKSTIFYAGQPLQTLFDKGILATKGYKRRTGEATKPIMKPPHGESNSSEEKSEEDDVEDDEAVDPGDETEEGRVEDEDDDDDVVLLSEQRETRSNVSTPEITTLEKEVKVMIKRLPEASDRRPSGCTELPAEDGWCQTSGGTEEEREEHRASQTQEEPAIAEPQVAPPRAGGAGGEDDGRREIKREKETSPPSYTLIRLEEVRSLRSHAADHRSSPPPSDTESHAGFTGDVTDERERRGDGEAAETPRCEAGEVFTAGDVGDVGSETPAEQRDAKDKVSRTTSASTEGKDESPGHTHASTSESVRRPQTRLIQTLQVKHSSRHSDVAEAPSPSPPTSTDLDTMDLDKLKREKIKRQLNVLKLQEEYYTLRIKELQK